MLAILLGIYQCCLKKNYGFLWMNLNKVAFLWTWHLFVVKNPDLEAEREADKSRMHKNVQLNVHIGWKPTDKSTIYPIIWNGILYFLQFNFYLIPVPYSEHQAFSHSNPSFFSLRSLSSRPSFSFWFLFSMSSYISEYFLLMYHPMR